MARVKKTKNELKSQREALARYHRFLPTLELKKQQLQAEVHHVEQQMRAATEATDRQWDDLRPWMKLLADTAGLPDHVRLKHMETSQGNIAGVVVPQLDRVSFEETEVDYYDTPAWFDEAVTALRELVRLRLEHAVLERQRDLLAEELRITSQRVNLFEKVKIPEARDNIRVINIALGDAQTAAVVRAKIAKGKAAAITSGKGS